MSASNFEFSMFGENFKDLDDLVDKVRDGVSSLYQERSMHEMLGIELEGVDDSGKIWLANKINEINFSHNFNGDPIHPGNPVLLQSDASNDLNKAALIFEILGYVELAKSMRRMRAELMIETMMKGVRDEASEKRIISADRRRAKKGKTNRHHSSTLLVASLTWGKYPNASLAGMSQEIYSHLREKWNDVPVVGTIEKWLKESGLNPAVKPKNRNFKLVINEG